MNLNFWQFLAGLGIFLFGMNQMESGLRELTGKSFRNLIQKFTNKPLKGILTGTLITSILQSSSLVTLMVLAFLGAGVLSLKHALGVILGANLGTTVTAWIVFLLGFKVSIASFSLPFIGIGAMVTILLGRNLFIKNFGFFLVGFGFLFFGMDLMKVSIESLSGAIDFSEFTQYGLIVFLLVGLVLTALIQSSSATMVILLSAINSGILALDQAAAAAIGANIGTTITVTLGAIGGTPDKKRLALLHFLFNVVTGMIVFFFVPLIVRWINSMEFGQDPLFDLALFNTFLNLFGIILFFPFLKPLTFWLQNRFVSKQVPHTRYIQNVDVAIPEAAIQALEKELLILYAKTKRFIKLTMNLDDEPHHQKGIFEQILKHPVEYLDLYRQLKYIEDEVTDYHLKLQKSSINEQEAKKLLSLMLSTRLMIFAAKDFKDIQHNIKELENSTRNLPKDFLERLKIKIQERIIEVDQMVETENGKVMMPNWMLKNEEEADSMIEELFEMAKNHKTDIPFSTLSNVAKEFSRGLYNLGAAVVHWRHPINVVLDPSVLSSNPSNLQAKNS
ncbi:MAG: Na/Pi cotransporter family protein [Algoriphagus sp.]|uniref:Na/Pi cotransporter family protein n=1 Tax=Algoriphagus sp. TaxID=1872435 RepID=UPI00185B232B|nr:Na/Pi symporter [Algoriphagus sp.]NVJ85729.1 Na/Pi cotransporter family protein [Algoriphagus sp.]